MIRRIGALVAAVGLSAGLVAGCGIPDHTDVQVDQAGPVAGSDQQAASAQPPSGRLTAGTPKDFVRNFLRAAAGEFDPGGKTSQRLQDYVAGDATRNFTLKDAVTVVRVGDIKVAEDNVHVHVDVEQVGTLNSAGVLLAPTSTAKGYDLQIRAESGAGGGWRVVKGPSEVLLDVEALQLYYTERTVYFWNTDRTALLPDLRWLPSEVPLSRVPTELLAMIEGGPSPWLEGVAEGLPKDSKLLINAPLVNGQLTMNWSPTAIDNDANGDYLVRQVAWTVSELGAESLQLKINGQLEDTYPVRDLINRTPYPIGLQAHAYAVLDHKVRALSAPVGTAAPVPLADAVNKDVQWAAFNRNSSGMDAAVVTPASDLRVGSGTGDIPVEALATVPGVKPTAAPVWLPRSRTGLVPTANGRLYRFGPDRKAALVSVKGLKDITAVAAAIDGQRIALIADGRLYVVPVSVMQDGEVVFGDPRQLDPQLADLRAVAWSGETAVSVSGKDADRMAIVDVSVDGVRRTPRIYDGEGPITMIAAYPEIKVLDRSTTMLYQAENSAWLAAGTSTQVERSMVDGAPPSASPGPGGESQPTAPFFVY
ncbi:lipoprotein LpqB [Asanoa ishikariensis]|uniref:Sporulation and spore germination n=1 Tax=Asanoa ishikariensis TaxID=137265 RepID=A0A1H3MGV9_9ACTN|nr:LpqB family beta-propeller domain-containing protein [Asanoa ishikariensis]GIF66095.1 lipoprotein LpqB [Asanoa ishikariensis]SDY75285.1 hypothetical protein SAMN05421684_1368 [Asanoa ishikariensis]